METKETIPTAEQFCKHYLKENWTSEYSSMDVVDILMPKALHEWGVLFARHHRKQQIEAIAKGLYEDFACDMGDQECIEGIVENAYPEERIK